MKKILCAFCALALGTNIYALDADAGVESQEQPADDQNNPNGHAAYEGLYFGGGINATSLGESSRYLDAGNNTDDKMSDDSSTRLGGNIVLGFGRKMPTNPFYIGLEAGFDFAPNSNFSHYDKVDSNIAHFYDVYGKRNGCVPNFGLRLGWVDRYTRILTFIKFGGSWSKTTVRYEAYDIAVNGGALIGYSNAKVSAVTPTIALGVEKAFGKKGTIRSEVEYAFGKSKEAQVHRTDVYNTWLANNPVNASSINDNDRVKLEKRGSLTLRVAICYHISFFNKGRIFTLDK